MLLYLDSSNLIIKGKNTVVFQSNTSAMQVLWYCNCCELDANGFQPNNSISSSVQTFASISTLNLIPKPKAFSLFK